jgi:hypothetical protein
MTKPTLGCESRLPAPPQWPSTNVDVVTGRRVEYSGKFMSSQLPAGLAVFGFLVFGVACSQKSEENCTRAQSVVRQALALKNFAAATQWREYAYKQCADTKVLTQLDKEIVTQQAQEEATKQQALQAEQQKQQVLNLFQQWVSSGRGAPERSVQSPTCEGDEKTEAAKAQERFCSGSRPLSGVPGTAFMVRFWESEPADAARYAVRMSTPTKCDALGPNRILKVISAPATNGSTVNRYHCEFMGGALNGLQALASEANNADLYVFTPKYVERDPSFAAVLK